MLTAHSFQIKLYTMWSATTVVVGVALLCIAGTEATKHFYTAAVFESNRFGSRSDPPDVVIDTNLRLYSRAAEIAKAKGADVIVFSEYGIIPPGSRQQLKPFLETVPDPTKIRTNPCEQSEIYSQRPILHRLSCIAKNSSMVVVGNLGDIQNCTGQSECPPDGVFHYNTNAVFDRNGELLVRYHKEHLFFERGMDIPTEKQTPVFSTDFGTFATFVCFDSMFSRMSEVARWGEIEGVMFPTMWVDAPPQLVSVQYWQAWALGNGVTLLAANGQKPSESAVGSGVFHGQEGALAYTFNPDGISKLVVSTVPKKGACGVPIKSSITAITDTKTWEFKDDGKDVPQTCSNKFVPETPDAYKCQKEKMVTYTAVQLTKSEGFVEVCNNGMCCSLNYTTDGLKDETFYLGVFNGTYSAFNTYFWWEENCVLTRCDTQGTAACSTFPLRSQTVFRSVQLKANFTTDFVFPSVMSSGVRLVPRSEWQHSRLGAEVLIDFKSSSGQQLTSLGLKGRCFDKDPPYKRQKAETTFEETSE
ncbi:hypothetical protein JTE90_017842 [Oedothorax gibbosus]|uniref:CN hydrolase domain-containing protein n=1 Tax=Oedothorax gibbosus TaxID=931172 RepID=A0AAV6VBR6_9ARAC|nr:hypothetical protein JTE90_017842 [Oedothorax gibbosus]